jgi:hypothetical protein
MTPQDHDNPDTQIAGMAESLLRKCRTEVRLAIERGNQLIDMENRTTVKEMKAWAWTNLGLRATEVDRLRLLAREFGWRVGTVDYLPLPTLHAFLDRRTPEEVREKVNSAWRAGYQPSAEQIDNLITAARQATPERELTRTQADRERYDLAFRRRSRREKRRREELERIAIRKAAEILVEHGGDEFPEIVKFLSKADMKALRRFAGTVRALHRCR